MYPFHHVLTIDTRLTPEQARAQLRAIVRPLDQPELKNHPFCGEVGEHGIDFVPNGAERLSPLVRGAVVAIPSGSRVTLTVRMTAIRIVPLAIIFVFFGLTSTTAALWLGAIASAGLLWLELGECKRGAELLRLRLGRLLPPVASGGAYR